jgi:hypothetical protein
MIQKTARREAREGYARFLLSRAGLEAEDIEAFMNTKQAILENQSPLEAIYTGDYERAIAAVETFTEDLTYEDIEDDFEFSGSVSHPASAS